MKDNRNIEIIMDSIEDTIRGNILNYKSPFEMDVQRIIDHCRKRKKNIIREFLEKQLKKTNSQKCECELDIWACPYCQVKEMMKELEGDTK